MAAYCTGNLQTNRLPAPRGIERGDRRGQIPPGGNQEEQQNGVIKPRPYWQLYSPKMATIVAENSDKLTLYSRRFWQL